jgi:D-alanine--poly(phosphoribitol) ligase subunit 1
VKRCRSLAELFSEVVQRHSALPAIICDHSSVTYQDLDEYSDLLVRLFKSYGITQNDVVAIISDKEPLGYCLIIACLKSGIPYVCVDEENPSQRLQKIFDTCGVRFVFSDHSLSESLNQFLKIAPITYVDVSEKSVTDYACLEVGHIEYSKPVGSSIAYIMFTSGSTGSPKGAAISNDNLLSFIGWSSSYFNVSPSDRFTQVSPLYFDNSVFDLYTAFFSGASLVPVKRSVSKNPRELVKLVDSLKCTIWFSVPSLLVYLLTVKALNKNVFRSIRSIIFGGEGFPKGELKKLFDLYFDRSDIINVYGPTESTCICSAFKITEADFEDMQKLAPLGEINPNFKYLILGDDLKRVGRGEKGELCLLGPNVGLGYYNDSERTETSFIQNPTNKNFRDIMYRTGDIVYEKNKLLHFAGRADSQIKHMGYRIELEEIEAALNSLPYVSQSVAVYYRKNEKFGKIICFVSSRDDNCETRVKRDLTEIIPSYMIPNKVLLQLNLPRTANGKIDRKKLLASCMEEK